MTKVKHLSEDAKKQLIEEVKHELFNLVTREVDPYKVKDACFSLLAEKIEGSEINGNDPEYSLLLGLHYACSKIIDNGLWEKGGES